MTSHSKASTLLCIFVAAGYVLQAKAAECSDTNSGQHVTSNPATADCNCGESCCSSSMVTAKAGQICSTFGNSPYVGGVPDCTTYNSGDEHSCAGCTTSTNSLVDTASGTNTCVPTSMLVADCTKYINGVTMFTSQADLKCSTCGNSKVVIGTAARACGVQIENCADQVANDACPNCNTNFLKIGGGTSGDPHQCVAEIANCADQAAAYVCPTCNSNFAKVGSGNSADPHQCVAEIANCADQAAAYVCSNCHVNFAKEGAGIPEAPNTCTPVEESTRPAPGAPAPAPLRISDDPSKSPSNTTDTLADTLADTSDGNTSFRPTWRLVVGLLLLMVVGGGEYLLM